MLENEMTPAEKAAADKLEAINNQKKLEEANLPPLNKQQLSASGTSLLKGSTTDLSDPLAQPSAADLAALPHDVLASAVATPQQIRAIAAHWVQEGLPASLVAPCAWQLARSAAHNGSSDQSQLPGAPQGSELSFNELAAIVKNYTSLRRFCMFYAKIVWNDLVTSNIPPAGWQRAGYLQPDRFAAFDFFDGVSNSAALQPKNGLCRLPTPRELIAQGSNRAVAIHHAAAGDPRIASTAIELTRGRLAPSAPLITGPDD